MAPDCLLVDLGNSRLKWALLEAGQTNSPGPVQAISHRDLNLAALLQQHWQGLRPRRVIICSVAGAERDQQLRQWIKQTWGISPFFFTSTYAYPGMRNGYAQPEKLGNDRWLGCIAAHQRCQGPVALVDAGTAITLDLVDGQGQHQGGWIIPGLASMGRCLLQSTAITATDFASADLSPGTDTASAIGQGALLACLGLLESAAARADANYRWLLTGGDAACLSPLLRLEHEVVEQLLLEGLALIAHHREAPR
ncbi:MAG: type III pantothenate kinase [Gammaproteobacteria bacterium]|nr:type III pantothenate kinase [Gammaproteobacteria bacterium]